MVTSRARCLTFLHSSLFNQSGAASLNVMKACSIYSVIAMIALAQGCASQPQIEQEVDIEQPLAMNPAFLKARAKTAPNRAPAAEPAHHAATPAVAMDNTETPNPATQTREAVLIPAPTGEKASWDYAHDVMLAEVQNHFGSVTIQADLKLNNIKIKPGTYTWMELGDKLNEFVKNCPECMYPQAKLYSKAIAENQMPAWAFVDFDRLVAVLRAEPLAKKPVAKISYLSQLYGDAEVGLSPIGVFRSLAAYYQTYYQAYYRAPAEHGSPSKWIGIGSYSPPREASQLYFTPEISHQEDFEVVFDTDPDSLRSKN